MALKKKKKLKTKNFIIFIIIVLITLFLIYKANEIIITNIFIEKTTVTEKTKKKSTNNDLKQKLKSLENINEKIDFFIDDYIDRYIAYHKKNKDIKIEQVIVDVNIGLDHEYYTNVKNAPNINTNYILVNKYYNLGKDYIPSNLKDLDTKYSIKGMKMISEAKDAFEKMAKDASKEKLHIIAMSTYRSHDYQTDLYNKYAKKDGIEAANTYSAKAGYSEHQTGLAADVYNGTTNYTSFEKTKEFIWMQENTHKYGFILRFPKDKEKETGYKYEPWHYRYVGKDIAKYIYDHKISYEEYYVRFIQNKEKER